MMVACTWQASTPYCLKPKFHFTNYERIFSTPLTFPQPFHLSPICTSLANQYIISPPTQCSPSVCVWRNRGLAPKTNHTALQQPLVGLDHSQTHTALTAHYVTGNPRHAQLVPKDQNEMGTCPKESEEGLCWQSEHMFVFTHWTI